MGKEALEKIARRVRLWQILHPRCVRVIAVSSCVILSILGFVVSVQVIFNRSIASHITSISPNGRKVAFVWEKQWYLPTVEGEVYKRHLNTVWCDCDNPRKKKSVKAETIGKEYMGSGRVPVDMKFSPDSKTIGLITPNYLSVIDVESEELVRLSAPGDAVTSFQWLDDEVIGYATVSRANQKHSVTFWSQCIHSTHEDRWEIARDSIPHEMGYWEDDATWRRGEFCEECWSPSGWHVIFANQHGGELKLVDTEAGSITPVFKGCFCMDTSEISGPIAWKNDESQVFCLGVIQGDLDNHAAFLIDTKNGHLIDCSRDCTFQENDDGFTPR